MEVDKDGAFSSVSIDVVYIEDVRKYIHEPITEINHTKFEELRKTLFTSNQYSYFP